ncbi:hypothetical protein SLEP1_g56308 [Rubroshorea leprosula]|uniref:Integrase catalytic domain-containing protein n=1 Tax=Rubroshorea leprosula TaxID=152421 RepID=A0AAV5MHZ1_9ROSI|nr:hypothetical protein SLEP1_g56308 [Rubroshorea leprosula]
MFPPVDHAKGGDENQPHASAHNSTSTANQDVVTAQLAAIQQQFSVFHLEKLVAEHRGAPPPHHTADSIPHPLNTNITLEPYPVGFKIPQLETYDGMKDPDDHLHAFYSCMQAQNASDALMCKIFPSTLRGNARTWYYSLPPRSISSYTEMTSAFTTKFSSRRLIRKTTSELMTVKQKDGESLKNYMSRFNDAVLEVSSFDQAVGIAAVISDLKHDRFRDSLIKHAAITFSEVNDRSLKFITAEEYALAQNPTPTKNQNPEWRDDNPTRKRMRMAQNRGPVLTSSPRFGRPNSTPPQQSASKPPVNWTPFNLPREQRPQPQGVRNPPNRQGVGYQQAPPLLPPPTRIIHMITGGLEAGGLSSKQRKLYVREVKHKNRVQKRKIDDAEWKNQPITFTSADLDTVVTPHNDPLVTTVMINNCEVQRVLVDTGSAPDIMYFHCFESLGLDPALLQKYDGPIYGFNNQPVPVEGVLTLHVAFGSGQTYFPTPMGIATLRGNQEVARHCYITLVTQPMKGKDQTPEAIPQRIPDTQQVMGVKIVDNRPDDEARDMPGIPNSICQHKLSTNPLKKPVAQKRRLFGGERLQAVKEEANGKWRMCIDYTNLNHTCPKDCYPMPSIDKLVEAASGNERLSLLDAYSGYHQVPMAPEDEEKTSFYAGDEIYCYVMMPFGLKNAGATYQKMVTIVFRAQIGKNLEVYVDDIVVKSQKAEDHLADLDETFNNLRKNKMRLNPAKCIFDVESRKFMGFMVSQRGIEVNPEKIRAIAEMESPKSVKDIQRSATQKDESGKQKKFEWSQESQAAFDELKSYLSSPPLLTKAVDGEILYLYLGISEEAISSVLLREEAKQQKPIYYISSVLHGAELRYPIAEKAALAVVTSARKLRPYFQSHPIIITFQQRSVIRAQALADFIVECTPCPSTSTPKPNDWTLYVDGASSSKGSGAGALLIGPEGYRSEHALKFNFDATNNMAEYEALLLGLQLALELKISAIQADSLSKFASNSSLSSRSVFVEILDEPSFMKPRVMEISTNPDTPSWTDSIVSFLRDGIIPEDRQEAMKLRKKASRYTLVDGVLYKRSFSLPLLRCLNPYEAEYALREVHKGVCGSHVGARTLAHKVLRQGYYWPNIHKDATYFVQKCSKCQFFTHLTHQPVEELTNMVAPWPFAQWGLDLLGPFVKGVGGVTHLVVGVDYFTKWVKARPLSSLTSKKVEDFVFSSIICRYGIPNQIVADNGTQFNCSSFRDFCSSYGIKLQFTSVYHPESNGMVESVNKCILEGIKLRLE